MGRLALIDASLRSQSAPATLTLVGSTPGILAGQPSRVSAELAVWKPRSNCKWVALRRAVQSAGMLFDPKGALVPSTPYLRIVEPGSSQLGRFALTEFVESFSTLKLERPPIANLVASKLACAEAWDLEDVVFLIATFRPEQSDIKKAVKSMPQTARTKASENLWYLRVLGSPEKRGYAPRSGREQELTARHLLTHLEDVPVYLRQRRWAELAAVADYAEHDAPQSLAHTDPALYRMLRERITEFRLRGWDTLDLGRLRLLAQKR